jgi:hypothetical protein
VIAKATADTLAWVLPFQAKPSSRTMTRSIRPCHSRVNNAPGFKTSGTTLPMDEEAGAEARSVGSAIEAPTIDGSAGA